MIKTHSWRHVVAILSICFETLTQAIHRRGDPCNCYTDRLKPINQARRLTFIGGLIMKDRESVYVGWLTSYLAVESDLAKPVT